MAKSPVERAVNLGLLALLLALGVLSFDRANRERYDFHHFYLDARYVWEHRQLNPDTTPVVPEDPRADDRRQLPFYLPVVPLALSPLTAFGRTPAALLWAAGQVLAAGISLRILRTWVRDSKAASAGTFALAIAFALPAFYEAARFNQLSYFVLALLLLALAALERGRPRLAGAIFAGAALLKLLPAIFLLWLLLKRRWAAVGAFAATVVLLGLLPPLLVFGPARASQYHQEWWQHNVAGDSARGLLNRQLTKHFIDHRNQSLPQVLARWTWAEHPDRVSQQPLQLSAQACTLLATGMAAALAFVLVGLTRRPWTALTPSRIRIEFAVYAIAMLVFSPLVRQYYLIWALPALVLLAEAARSQWPGRLGLMVWLAGMLCWIWPETRLVGAHLVMLIVLGALLLTLRGDREPPARIAT